MQDLTAMRQEFVQALSSRYDTGEAGAMFRILQEEFGTGDDAADLQKELDSIVSQLLTGRPFQYVLGKAWFYGLTLHVNESVLIPRPETEELVDRIIQSLKAQDRQNPTIIDIGTGSGCIALAIKKALPQAVVYALDVSGKALSVARQNAKALNLEINFVQADILEWELVTDPKLQLDVVVSNPPYITPGEKESMELHVLDFEPDLALFVPAESPLLFYQYIADFARHQLWPGGKLYFEINKVYGLEIKELLEKMGYKKVEIVQDMQGADRMIEAIH